MDSLCLEAQSVLKVVELKKEDTISDKNEYLEPLILQYNFELMPSKSSQIMFFNRKAVSTIISFMFFGLIKNKKDYPKADFESLLSSLKISKMQRFEDPQSTKLKCLINYFYQMKNSLLDEGTIISYQRKVLKDVNWEGTCESMALSEIHILEKGKIQEQSDCKFVDFADELIGGGFFFSPNIF